MDPVIIELLRRHGEPVFVPLSREFHFAGTASGYGDPAHGQALALGAANISEQLAGVWVNDFVIVLPIARDPPM